MWEHGGLARWHNGIRTSSTSWCQDISSFVRIMRDSFSLEPSMGILLIVLHLPTRRNVWNFPGKGKTKWTQCVDEDGRSSRTDNSKEESMFTKETTLASLWKKSDEQPEATVETRRCFLRGVMSSDRAFHPKHG